RQRRAAAERHRGEGCAHPARAGRRGRPGRRRAPLPPHRQGNLPRHPADDRPADRVRRLHVLAVTPEVFPLVKTGGLADVAGALPLALRELEIDTTTLVPGYPAVMAALIGAEEVHAEPALFGGPARLLRATAGGLDLLVLDAPHL